MSVVLEPPKIEPAPESVSREAAVFRVLETLESGRNLRMGSLSWDDYLAFDEWRDRFRPGLRMSYYHGELEFMTISFEHDATSTALQDVIKQLGIVFGLPVRGAGSTTFRREAEDAGLEPDECFFIRNAPAVRGLKKIDLSVTPPPDLAVEVDYSNSSLPKLPIYGAIGVPEVWRVKAGRIVFFVLRNGEYAESKNSASFPLVEADALSQFFYGTDWPDDTALMAAANTWATSLVPPKS